MKIKIAFLPIISIILITVLFFGFYFYISNWPLFKSDTYGQIKPEATTNLNSKKFVKVEASSSAVTIADKILGAKVVLPVTVVTTDKGDNLLVLIDKKIKLPVNYTPTDLVFIDGFPGARLRSEAAVNFLAMIEAAKGEGLSLTVVSAFRSYQEQDIVFKSWVTSVGLKSAENFSANPGFSQHQLGTAVDFGAGGKVTFNDSFGKTLEGVWLVANAYKFGFVISYPVGKEAITGYKYEPWHYRYIGVTNAQTMITSNLILEDYLQQFGVW